MPKMKLQKHTLNLRAGDYAAISEAFDSKGWPASRVIQTLVSNFVDRNLNREIPDETLEELKGVDLDG